ncbi:cullin-associated NEDD8-dissociated protein 1-like [Diabrotica undecimpunctata]|uniref:cullin-associated NEDD8-dissociated protein 1-like n=1 Tax=Diabrotica undecimpunctata TaxID=50387 RepID=UPI003B63D619
MVFQKVFLLLCVGEVGRLSSSLVPRFEDIFILFSHASEEVKVAASWAVAGICIGNLSDCLPFIVQQSQTPSAIQLWLLISLNKVMTYFGQSIDRSQQFLPYVSLVWEELIKHSGSDEDGIRDSVTEGLSKLTLIDPTNCLPKLKLLLDSPSPIIRFTAMAAFHLTISDQPSTIDPLLREWIEDFLVALRDSDVRVRRAAIVTFNSAVYNKPVLVTHLLDSILPDIYKETVVQDDLITIIEQGSLRLIFDNGLDTRKAAYECLYTVLDCLSNKLDLFDFMKHIIRGLGDQRDVKIFTFNLIEKLTLVCPRLVSQTTDLFIEPLNKIFSLELPIGAPNEDQEQITEIKTFALRVIISLLNMPNAEKNPHLVRLVRQIKATDYWLTIFEAVQTVFEIPESMTNMINKI